MDLKPCPFCGAEDIRIDRIYFNPLFGPDSIPDEVRIGCPSCGLEGFIGETEEEVVELWNFRFESLEKSL